MKTSSQKVSVNIQSSPADAWEIIGAVDGVEQWLGPITACRVEGDKRYCSTDAGEFSEDILEVDHNNRVLKYAIPQQHMLPVENILGSMTVREGNDGGAVVDWEWSFDVDEENEAQAKEMLTHVGEMGINGIEALIHSRQAV